VGAAVASCEESAIAHCAHIYLQRRGTKIAVDLGEKDLDVRPIRYGRAQFGHDGRTEVGKIERIDPADWETTGLASLMSAAREIVWCARASGSNLSVSSNLRQKKR
jgi:hypothetical protein